MLRDRLYFYNLDFATRVDSKNGHTEFTHSTQEQFKEKRKRTNSIMQIERHIENKIVKGWNQMINDLAPKMSGTASSVVQDGDQQVNNYDVPHNQREMLQHIEPNTFQCPAEKDSRCRFKRTRYSCT